MTQPQQFGFGLVQAPFVTSSGILTKAWRVIASRDERIVPHVGNGLVWKIYEEQDLMVVAFEVQPGFDLKPDLVSSSHLKEDNFPHFQFLCNKKFPVFSVNRSAVLLFRENLVGLDQLKARINSSPSPRLIVTGLGLGGPIASLFTLSLLDSIGSGKKRPLCITFGSPLIGNRKLQEAISRSSTWSSCFLHVVSYNDPLPKKLKLDTNEKLKPDTSAYMPFGTFLFCSDVNSTCFEYPKSVLELLVYLINYTNQGFQPIEYGNIVENLYRKAICKDFTPWVQDLTDSTSLHASIYLQVCAALGLTRDVQQQQQQIVDLNTLVPRMKTLEQEFIHQNRAKFDPSKKLNLMKIEMAQLEWYKKDCKRRGIGYYDSFKTKTLRSDQDVVQYQKNLTNYWIQMVEEAEMKPQREGAAFRIRWLYAGTNCRRMVEPLDIGEYYAKGSKDYENQRSRHYIVLEEWLEEDRQNAPDSSGPNRRNVELLLTFDSCFWAYVEEALLLCKQLQSVRSSETEREEATNKLLVFEEYVYGLLKKYEVSPEIFLKESSYMKWWNQYREISGKPELASFMNNPHHYDQYTVGTYDFP